MNTAETVKTAMRIRPEQTVLNLHLRTPVACMNLLYMFYPITYSLIMHAGSLTRYCSVRQAKGAVHSNSGEPETCALEKTMFFSEMRIQFTLES